MNPYSSSSQEYPEERILDKLGYTLEDLSTTIHEATEIILTKKRKPFEHMDLLIHDYRLHVLVLLEDAKRKYTQESSNGRIIALMEKKMGHSMKEYEFYTLMAHIFESDKSIKSLEQWVQTTPWFGKIVHSLFSLFRHNRKEFLENILNERIACIISDIETLLQDPHCQKLTHEERDTFEEKWKEYMDKAGARGMNLGDNSETGEDEVSIAPQHAFDQISACQGGIDDFAKNVEVVIRSVTVLVNEIEHDQSEAISESKCALDKAYKSYQCALSLYKKTIDFTRTPIFGELDEPKKDQYNEVVQAMQSDITKLHSQYGFFGGLYRIECGELELRFLWEQYRSHSDILNQIIIDASFDKKTIHNLRKEIEHLKNRISGEIQSVLTYVGFVMGNKHFLKFSPERRKIYSQKLESHKKDLKQI